MKNKISSQDQPKETYPLLQNSGIGMYEMLAQAQPDVSFGHSSLLNEVCFHLELPEIIDE